MRNALIHEKCVCIPFHSEFKLDLFKVMVALPDLSKVFPWKNFFGNTQRAYLMKEETVTGTWGVEGRYPFLDKQVVQEFLWLRADLKNSQYKSVIDNYFVQNNFPFSRGEKKGF